jgi:hypothetical protein
MRTQPALGRAAGAEATVVLLPGDPPAPVAAWNEIFAAENPSAGPERSYDDGWYEGRQDLLKQITALVAADTPAP